MKKLFGGMLMGCGILVAGLSGLCTLLAAGTAVMDMVTQDPDDFSAMLPNILILGGVPIAVGVGLFFLGRHLNRQADVSKVDLDRNNPFE